MQNNMTLEELEAKHAELNAAVLKLLRDFSEDTGMNTDDIDLITNRQIDGVLIVRAVDIKVSMKGMH